VVRKLRASMKPHKANTARAMRFIGPAALGPWVPGYRRWARAGRPIKHAGRWATSQ
jgi:hypothetical protein